MAGKLETSLASQQARDLRIPKFVEDEFGSFLEQHGSLIPVGLACHGVYLEVAAPVLAQVFRVVEDLRDRTPAKRGHHEVLLQNLPAFWRRQHRPETIFHVARRVRVWMGSSPLGVEE